VDTAVLTVASTAHGQQGRASAEIDVELFLDRTAQCGTGQRGDEPREGRPVGEGIDRKAAVAANVGKIRDERRQRVTAHKFFDDDEIEGVADEWRRAQAVEIENAQPTLPNSEARRIMNTNGVRVDLAER